MSIEDWIPWDSWDDLYDEYPTPPDKTLKYNQIIARTKKAVFIEDDVGSYWLPKSVCKLNRFKKTVTIQGWFLSKIHYIEKKPPEHPNPRGTKYVQQKT